MEKRRLKRDEQNGNSEEIRNFRKGFAQEIRKDIRIYSRK